MKIRTVILRRFVALALVGLASQVICRAELKTVNTITNDASTIGLFFDPPLTLPSATNAANYSVYTKTGQVSVASVTLQTNNQFATLKLATNIVEFFYVNVTNIVDIETNTVDGYTLGYISDYGSRNIGTAGDPSPVGNVYTARRDTFEVTASGSGVGGTNDHFRFISLPVIGDFDTAVQVTQLDQADDFSQAGLMAREFLTAGSRTLQTYFTPTGGTNEIQSTMRTATNGTTSSGFQVGAPPSATPLRWLRLTRTNNLFTAYHGSNGLDWTISAVTTQAFASTLNIGMMVSSHTNGGATTAAFTGFGTVGVRPGDNVLPSLSASVAGGTNVALNWNRTPRDFTIEASTNLTDWSLVLATILETGTNGTGRLMNVAMETNDSQSFYRLKRVDRVIPDPPLALYTGLVLSLANGNVVTSNSSVMCTYTVRDSIAQNSLYGQPNKIVSFSTADSGASLDTVLRTRWLPALNPPCDDDSAGFMKSIQYFTNTATRTNFTFIAAVKTNTPVTSTSTIKVSITVY